MAQPLRMQSLPEFLAQPRPPAETLISPWLQQGGIAMLYGWRGSGKTNVALSLALCAAGGTTLFPGAGMHAPRPRRVLYVDGEMHPAEVQERFKKFLRGGACASPENLIYLTHDDYPRGIPDLALPGGEGRELVEHACAAAHAELLILDNISSLFRSGEENSNDAWVEPGEWLLSLRRQNLTTLLIHHAGKRKLDGTLSQRGNSKREDNLNVTVQIDATAKPRGGRVPLRWTYEKFRNFTPDEPSFDFAVVFDDRAGTARLEEGGVGCRASLPEPGWLPQAQALIGEGTSIKETARRVGEPYTTVYRYLKGHAPTVGELGAG